MIKLICFGKIKEKYLVDLIEDYKKRINKYHNLTILELKDDIDQTKESASLLKQINNRDYVILLDINGKQFSSEEFASFIDNQLIKNSNIVFIIGSSVGVSNEIKERANEMISFSKLTLPHGLFRGVFLEQLYRAFKINSNETYHK